MKGCVGFDKDGEAFRCLNPPGTRWTKVWCPECDKRRRARISEQLRSLADAHTEWEANLRADT